MSKYIPSTKPGQRPHIIEHHAMHCESATVTLFIRLQTKFMQSYRHVNLPVGFGYGSQGYWTHHQLVTTRASLTLRRRKSSEYWLQYPCAYFSLSISLGKNGTYRCFAHTNLPSRDMVGNHRRLFCELVQAQAYHRL